jgi:hypothetical protein
MTNRCTTGKVRFTSRRAAIRFHGRRRSRSVRHAFNCRVRAYRCDVCGEWHVTRSEAHGRASQYPGAE